MSRYTHHCSVCDAELLAQYCEAPPCHPAAAIYMRQSEPPSRFEERVAAVNEAGGLDVTVLASSAHEDLWILVTVSGAPGIPIWGNFDSKEQAENWEHRSEYAPTVAVRYTRAR
jgi:hypothetical protein